MSRDHKFVDSNHCLKCGWEPPQRPSKVKPPPSAIEQAAVNYVRMITNCSNPDPDNCNPCKNVRASLIRVVLAAHPELTNVPK